MNGEQWEHLKLLFDQAHSLDKTVRVSLLERECGTNSELREELEALLLASRESDSGFLEGCALDEHQSVFVGALSQSLEGARIGPWRIIREIGAGGMGSVYLAEREDGAYKAQAALKIVREGMDSAVVLRRFYQERQILAELNHPGIARLIDGGMCPDGRPFLAMEYIEGSHIDEYCDKNALSIKDRLQLFLQVCNAVQFAHQHLVVHRDIKPGNILVTSDGTVRLLDFGVAKLLDRDSSNFNPDLTVAGESVLTPQYASPEQIRGELITVATDVYALGLLLYRLLTGKHPYQVATFETLKQAVCEQEPGSPSSVAEPRDRKASKKLSWSRDLDLITLQALRKEPQRRYQSVEQFADDVRRYLRNMPVSARPDSARYRAGKFVVRHKTAIAAIVPTLIILCLGIAAVIWQAGIARTERARAERRSADTRRIADSLLFELYDVLKEIPGTTAARELIARRGTDLFQELSQEAGPDIELRRELAAGYIKLADITGGAARSNIGNSATAKTDYQRAAALYESLIKQGPVQANDLHGLGVAYSAISAISDDNPGQARERWAERAKQIDLEGMRRFPADLRFRRGLAHDLQLIGSNFATHGELQRDLMEHAKALQFLQALVEVNDPQEEDWAKVSFAHKRLAAILIKLNRLDDALAHNKVALDIDQQLLRKKPDDASKQMAITYAYNDIGYIYAERREWNRALDYYRQGLSIREALAASDHNEARVKEGLGNSWWYIGEIFRKQGNIDQAFRAYARCLAIRKAQADTHTADSTSQLKLAEIFRGLGSAYAARAMNQKASATRDWTAARTLFQDALKIYAELGVSGKNFALDDGTRLQAQSGLAEAERRLAHTRK